MKLTFVVTIDIDVAKWQAEYGDTVDQARASLGTLERSGEVATAITEGVYQNWPVLADIGTVRVGAVHDVTPPAAPTATVGH